MDCLVEKNNASQRQSLDKIRQKKYIPKNKHVYIIKIQYNNSVFMCVYLLCSCLAVACHFSPFLACGCHHNGSRSISCDKSTGVCPCRDGFTGTKCDRCSPSGTTGVFPFCELCDECSTRWDGPVRQVREDVSAASEQVRLLQNRTEVEDSGLLRPLQQLLMEIQAEINSRNIIPLTGDIISNYSRLCNLIEVFGGLLRRLEVAQRQVANSRNLTTLLTTQLDTLITRLDFLTELLRNLSRDAMLLGPIDTTPYVTMLEEAEKRSNQSYELVRNNVTRLASETEGNLAQLAVKLPVFLNLRSMTLTVLETLRNEIRDFWRFINRTNTMLCGSSEDTCGECGGVRCDTCGGLSCNGSVSQVQRARLLTQQAQNITDQLYQQLLNATSVLSRARNVSEVANSTSSLAEQEAIMAATSSRELLQSIQELLGEIRNQLAGPLPSVTLIEMLQNEALSLQLRRTPEEVSEH